MSPLLPVILVPPHQAQGNGSLSLGWKRTDQIKRQQGWEVMFGAFLRNAHAHRHHSPGQGSLTSWGMAQLAPGLLPCGRELAVAPHLVKTAFKERRRMVQITQLTKTKLVSDLHKIVHWALAAKKCLCVCFSDTFAFSFSDRVTLCSPAGLELTL